MTLTSQSTSHTFTHNGTRYDRDETLKTTGDNFPPIWWDMTDKNHPEIVEDHTELEALFQEWKASQVS